MGFGLGRFSVLADWRAKTVMLSTLSSAQETSELGGMDVHIARHAIGERSFHEVERSLSVRYVRERVDHLVVRPYARTESGGPKRISGGSFSRRNCSQ